MEHISTPVLFKILHISLSTSSGFSKCSKTSFNKRVSKEPASTGILSALQQKSGLLFSSIFRYCHDSTLSRGGLKTPLFLSFLPPTSRTLPENSVWESI